MRGRGLEAPLFYELSTIFLCLIRFLTVPAFAADVGIQQFCVLFVLPIPEVLVDTPGGHDVRMTQELLCHHIRHARVKEVRGEEVPDST